MVFLIFTKYASTLLTVLIEYRKELAKITKKNKKNKKKLKKLLSKIDVLDFNLDCTKLFLMKFCQHGSNLRQNSNPL